MKSIGEKIIDAIIAGKLVSCECANCEDSSCVLTWSANVHEQISQIISDYQPQAKQLHKVLCKDSLILFTIICWPYALAFTIIFSLPYMAICLLYAKLKAIRDRRLYRGK
jgi:hypothetical protein